MITLPALSVRQPWPWAMIHAGKDIENRSWPTKRRGMILIHAGLRFDDCGDDWVDFIMGEAMRRGMTAGQVPAAKDLQRGGIVATAEIGDCVTKSDSPWFFGPYGFVLRNVRPVPFHACPGRLSFFKVDYPYEVAA